MAKVIIAAIAIYWVLQKIDLHTLKQTIVNAELKFFVPASALYILSKIIASYRLNSYFLIDDIKLKAKEHISLYWLGMFYNLFLPGGIGGDGYKVYLLNKVYAVKSKRLLGSLLADRISGLFALLSLSVVLFSILFGYIYLILLPIGIVCYLIFHQRIYRRFQPLFWWNILLSVCVQLSQLVAVFFLILAFGLGAESLPYLLLFLLSSVVSIVPISIGGIGIRELCFLYGSQYLDLSEPKAVAISFSFYCITMICSLPGLLFIFRSPLEAE